MSDGEPSLLDKLDAAVPAPLAQFDAFPKLPASYKVRSESRGFLTLFVTLAALLLMLNDVAEFIWGWPDYEFAVDRTTGDFMNINIDLVVNMPCRYLSVDLRDAIGDRLFLSGGVSRDGTIFDVGQATSLKAHSAALSARQAVAQSRSSRGFFAALFKGGRGGFKPTYNYKPDGSACRVWGSLEVKKVTANLHITTLGHGYASHEHVDHKLVNLSHVITEFSFGPHFPDITQPLDYSFETTQDSFVAYQYFLHVVPTTYIAPRSAPLHTHQYSVTHYTRVLEHNKGTPGIFFKFDLDPLRISIHQRTTTLVQLLIRVVGVVGGIFVCMGYALRITTRAVEVVSGADQAPGLVAAEASGARAGLRAKWGGAALRARPPARAGPAWADAPASPYSSYAGSPAPSPFLASSAPGTPAYGGASPAPARSPLLASAPYAGAPASPYAASGLGSPYVAAAAYAPGSPAAAYGAFPPSPNPAAAAPASPGPPRRIAKKDD